ncbi:MAG: ATP-dependent sacrificial sulfur transferase LarE [Spirochaetes bacterium]|nr:ATP-dependent sacrificial sulfur transferase LarE [Spirochaetota bacterium]
MENLIQSKLLKLDEILASFERVAVAFSGGVDSAFLLHCAHERLGDRAVAATAETPLVPSDEIEAASSFATEKNIEHVIIPIDLFQNSAVVSNPSDRCYHCKLDIFRAILDFAASRGIPHVIEGSNSDDRNDYRPGMRALAELGVRSPLMEAGLTKDEIRRAARGRGLSAWSRPAGPCLATRVPHGVAITRKMLDAIDRAERYLRGLGFSEVRVRHHGDLARIEVPRQDRARLCDHFAEIAARLKSHGFRYITLDIEGYRRGSMNRTPDGEEADGQG